MKNKIYYLAFLVIGLLVAVLIMSMTNPNLPLVKRKEKPFVYKLKVPEDKAYLGVDVETHDGGLKTFEKAAGKKMAILMMYVYWGQKNPYFNDAQAQMLWKERKVLVITWNPSESVLTKPIDQPKYRMKKILDGDFDPYIKKWVSDLKKWRRPVVMRFAPEMNGDWLPWGDLYTTPAEYIKTYRYVVDFFKKERVDNVSWMWSPNEAGSILLSDYYPGDDYVDWVGLSGFNWGGLKHDLGWRTLEDMFTQSFEQLRSINKPIAIAETGAIEGLKNPYAKANWFKKTYDSIERKHHQIKMMIYFNGTSKGIYDWRIDSSDTAKKGFHEAISSDYFLDRAEVIKIEIDN